jgi:hypothetical protein
MHTYTYIPFIVTRERERERERARERERERERKIYTVKAPHVPHACSGMSRSRLGCSPGEIPHTCIYAYIHIHMHTHAHTYKRAYTYTQKQAQDEHVRMHTNAKQKGGREKRLRERERMGTALREREKRGGSERHRGNNKERGDERGMQGLQGCGFVDETECVCVRVRRHACAVHPMQKKKDKRKGEKQCRRSMPVTQETPNTRGISV